MENVVYSLQPADEETGVESPGGMSKLMKLVGSRA